MTALLLMKTLTKYAVPRIKLHTWNGSLDKVLKMKLFPKAVALSCLEKLVLNINVFSNKSPCLLDDNSLDLYVHFSLNYLDNKHIFINPCPPTLVYVLIVYLFNVIAWCAH